MIKLSFSKMDMIHDEDYQKKLFSAAQNYMGQKHKKDLMDNIRRFNWKVQNGQKSSRIKVSPTTFHKTKRDLLGK